MGVEKRVIKGAPKKEKDSYSKYFFIDYSIIFKRFLEENVKIVNADMRKVIIFLFIITVLLILFYLSYHNKISCFSVNNEQESKQNLLQTAPIKSSEKTQDYEENISHLERAKNYISRKDYNSAISVCDTAILEKNENDQIYVIRGIAYIFKNEVEKGISDFDAAIIFNPSSSWAYYNRGTIYGRIGSYKKAIPDFSKAIELFAIREGRSASYLNRGRSYEGMKKFKNALNDYDFAIREDPKNPIVYYNKAKLLDKLEYKEKALILYTKFISVSKNKKENQIYQDTFFALNEDIDLAIRDTKNRIQKLSSIESFQELVNRANYFVDKDNLKAALIVYNEAYNKNKMNPLFYLNRGMVYRKNGNYKMAIIDLTSAIKLAPKNPVLYNKRAELYALIGNFENSIRDQTKAMELKPNDFKSYYDRGIIYGLKKDYSRAIKDFNTAEAIKPDYALIFLMRGQTFSNMKNESAKIKDYKKFISLIDSGHIPDELKNTDKEKFNDFINSIKGEIREFENMNTN